MLVILPREIRPPPRVLLGLVGRKNQLEEGGGAEDCCCCCWVARRREERDVRGRGPGRLGAPSGEEDVGSKS